MLFRPFNTSYHRQLLESKISEHASLMAGNVLEIGSGNRRYDHLFSATITAVDIKANPVKNVLQGDMHHLNFPDQAFDGALSLEVLCYSDDYHTAIDEMLRVTKPKATLLLSLPFLVRDSQDRIRFTRSYITEVLHAHGLPNVEVTTFGNSATLLWDILRSMAVSRKNPIAKIVFRLLFLPYYWLVKLFRLDRHPGRIHYSGIFIVIQR